MTEPIRVLIVDDSSTIRSLLHKRLEKESDIRVFSRAVNGEMAVDIASEYADQIDVVLLDLEMPGMDGITALPLLIDHLKDTPIIIVSRFSLAGADITVKALSLGAADFVTKPKSDEFPESVFFEPLLRKIRELTKKQDAIPLPPIPTKPLIRGKLEHVELIAIAASTGGPQALIHCLSELAGLGNVNVPIVVTQHMPKGFTSQLAQHMTEEIGIKTHEVRDGEAIKPGHIYLAPGDYHMIVEGPKQNAQLRLTQSEPVNFCRPSADPMLQTVANIYGPHALALVLTGMGQDAVEGCRALKIAGGQVVIQDRDSSVVWGMPGAVAKESLHDVVLPLDAMAAWLHTRLKGGAGCAT